jgi:zinc and cadmium transporter
VLIYGGFSKQKALIFNFFSALAAIVGALMGYFVFHAIALTAFVLPLTAGGFTYIATSDLIPEIHKERDSKRSTGAFLAFLLGILFMAAARIWLKE